MNFNSEICEHIARPEVCRPGFPSSAENPLPRRLTGVTMQTRVIVPLSASEGKRGMVPQAISTQKSHFARARGKCYSIFSPASYPFGPSLAGERSSPNGAVQCGATPQVKNDWATVSAGGAAQKGAAKNRTSCNNGEPRLAAPHFFSDCRDLISPRRLPPLPDCHRSRRSESYRSIASAVQARFWRDRRPLPRSKYPGGRTGRRPFVCPPA